MKKPLLLCFALLTGFASVAQINVGGIIRDKANQNAARGALEKLKKDGKEPKGTSSEGAGNNSGQEAEGSGSGGINKPSSAPETLNSYSKFDFVPGDAVVYFDDFAQDNIADFPARWNTNGSGEVVTTNRFPGKWLKLQNSSYYTPDLKRMLPENFTIEFDMIIEGSNPTGHQGTMAFAVISSKQTEAIANDGDAYAYTSVNIYSDNTSTFSASNSTGTLSNSINDNILTSKRGKKIHVSIAVNKQRYRIWYDQKKIFDLPRMMPTGHTYNVFRIKPSGFSEEEGYTALIGNLRIAEGSPDVRSKLLTEGKLVTRGITFDSGSDKIKPESYGTLKEIGKVLAENEGVKVKIVGHTDSDGADAANLELSKKRSIAIRTALEKEFGIAGNRMETDGKGESVPASPNATAEGKANNRRVEFIKI